MKLFETFFTKDYQYYQRYFDTDKNQSVIEEIDSNNEYFIEDFRGNYKDFVSGVKLSKGIGRKPNNTKTYGTRNAGYTLIRDKYWDVEESRYNITPRIWYLDIETTAETAIDVINTPQELILIQIYDTVDKSMIVIGSQPWVDKEYFTSKLNYTVKYVQVDNEIEIFKTYSKLIKHLKPMIVYGWNTEGFDYPFLFNRAKKLGFSSDIFSINYNSKLSSYIDSSGSTKYSLDGGPVTYLDLLDFYKKYAFRVVSSYSLNNIATLELGEAKVDHSEYSNFDGFRTGDGYIPPKEIPTDSLDREMYYIQIKANKTEEDIKRIREIAWSKFVYYGCEDTMLTKLIDDKIQITNIAIAVSSKMGVLFCDVLGTVKPWSTYISNYLMKDNIVVNDIDKDSDTPVEIKGGWVMDPIVGKHKWIVSFDFASLYPSVMRAYNMSPETIIHEKDLHPELKHVRELLKNGSSDFQDEDNIINLSVEDKEKIQEIVLKHNVSVGCNGVFFKNDKQGLIPYLLENIYIERKKFKKEMLKAKDAGDDFKAGQFNIKQMTNKILLNSLYGALGNKFMPLFNQDIARAVTMNGRVSNKYVASKMNDFYKKNYDFNNLVIYGDTDSVYLQLGDIGEKIVKDKDYNSKIDSINDFCNKTLMPQIQGYLDELANFLNPRQPEVIEEDREAISDSGVFIAKKRYFLRLRDNEGVRFEESKPYIKRMGIEIVKSSTPEFTKKHLYKSMELILDKDEEYLRNWVNNVKSQFTKVPIADISKTSSVSKISDSNWGKVIDGRKVSVPINSAAAVAGNSFIQINNLSGKYNFMQSGDKIKFTYLQVPNRYNSKVMGFIDGNMGEELRDIVDYDTNFEKFFMSPLSIMIEPLGWDMSKNINTEDW